MGDPPKLPDSPLTAMREDEPDVRRGPWIRRMRWIGWGLVAAFGAGMCLPPLMYGGNWLSLPDLDDLTAVAAIGGASLLLGLMALQRADRAGRSGLVAAIVARPLAALVGGAYTYIAVENWGELTAVGFGGCGLVASALVMLVPVRRQSRAMGHVVTAMALAALVGPGFLVWEVWPSALYIDWLEVAMLVAAGGIPIAGCLAVVWMNYTEPRGGASDE